MVKRIVVFKVYRTDDLCRRVINLGVTINRIKRLTDKKLGENIWQFTGTLRMSDTYMLEGIDRILRDVKHRYVGGEFGMLKGRITWSPTSKNIKILSHEEFTLFQR